MVIEKIIDTILLKFNLGFFEKSSYKYKYVFCYRGGTNYDIFLVITSLEQDLKAR